MQSDKEGPFVTALARGLSVLRCFTRENPVLGTHEIARMTGLPQPTVWRLCQTLVSLGYLRATTNNRLRLGVSLLALGYEVLAQHDIAGLAKPSMQDLAERYQGAVSLGTPDGEAIVYLQRCAAGSVVLANLSVGSAVPIACSAIGWAYLASLSDDERHGVISGFSVAERAAFASVIDRFDVALVDYHRRGYIVAAGILHPEINAAAVAINPGADPGDTRYFLSCGGAASAFLPHVLEKVGDELVRLASELQRGLGNGGTARRALWTSETSRYDTQWPVTVAASSPSGVDAPECRPAHGPGRQLGHACAGPGLAGCPGRLPRWAAMRYPRTVL